VNRWSQERENWYGDIINILNNLCMKLFYALMVTNMVTMENTDVTQVIKVMGTSDSGYHTHKCIY
jgi:hypothetical protein